MPFATVSRAQAPSRAVRSARTAALVALLALLGLVVLGGQLLASALLLPDGRPLDVAPAVRLRPPSGWRLVARQAGTRPALLTRGSANLAVLATGEHGDAGQLAGWYLEHELRPRAATAIAWRPLGRVRAAGGDGLAFDYRGELAGDRRGPVSGEVVVAAGVVFDAWALPDVFPYERHDVRAIVEHAQVAR
jgi:hypothetical protein